MNIKRQRSWLLAVAVIAAIISQSALGQAPFDDSQMRRNAADRIAREHQITIDWRNISLLEITDIEARLNATRRIKRDHGIAFDWRITSLLKLTDAEARLNAVKRIKRDHGVDFDWQKTSLLVLTDAEARMNAAARIARATGKAVDWRKYSLMQLLEAEAKSTGVDAGPVMRGAARSPVASGGVAPLQGLVIETKVDGDFKGWDGETIVKLMNGQIWQQTEYYYEYHYGYMPNVVIYNSGGSWKMKVEGVDKAVRVDRLK